jgi:hypothetical protein
MGAEGKRTYGDFNRMMSKGGSMENLSMGAPTFLSHSTHEGTHQGRYTTGRVLTGGVRGRPASGRRARQGVQRHSHGR